MKSGFRYGVFSLASDCQFELRMRARWKLGRLLAKVERKQGERTDRQTSLSGLAKSFRGYLKEIGLTSPTALAAQRIGLLPPKELEGVLAEAREVDALTRFELLIDRARPWWHKEKQRRAASRTKANFVSVARPRDSPQAQRWLRARRCRWLLSRIAAY